MVIHDLFDVRVEIAGRRLYGERYEGWGLVDVPGLWDSASNRDLVEFVPGVDGDLSYEEPEMEGLRFTIQGRVVSSSPGWGKRDRSWLRALAKRPDLEFRLFEAESWRYLRGAQVDGRVRVATDYTGLRTDFEIPVRCGDPRWYGVDSSFTVDAVAAPRGGLRFPIVSGALAFGESGAVSFPGAFQIHNPGSAGFYPVFRVAGPVDSFTVSSESLVLEYVAPVPAGQVLTLSPYAGGRAVLAGADVSHNLTRAGWVPVDPDQTRGYLFTPLNPGLGAQLEVTYPEGAWW